MYLVRQYPNIPALSHHLSGTEPDAVRPRIVWHDGVFCSNTCHDSYHDAD
ncbi:MAG TPA: hypothetical protein VEK11_01590 [Thermoanaerobaculia bacterium]|nr:hypothetical protein [Thermoanaerobaculia bacterium]